MQKLSLTLATTLACFILSACATSGSSQNQAKYQMIDLAMAKQLHERDVLFIDIRSVVDYEAGHIPGAANIDPRRFTSNSLARIARKDQEIVFYCYGIHCPLSDKASNKALLWGYQKVYYFMKGFPEWWGAGYPIEQSPP